MSIFHQKKKNIYIRFPGFFGDKKDIFLVEIKFLEETMVVRHKTLRINISISIFMKNNNSPTTFKEFFR